MWKLKWCYVAMETTKYRSFMKQTRKDGFSYELTDGDEMKVLEHDQPWVTDDVQSNVN